MNAPQTRNYYYQEQNVYNYHYPVINFSVNQSFGSIAENHLISQINDYEKRINSFYLLNNYSFVVSLFNEMKSKQINPNKNIYINTAISFIKLNEENKAINLIEEMGSKADTETYNSVIKCSLSINAYNTAYCFFERMLISNVPLNNTTYTILMDRCVLNNNFEGVLSVFNEMKKHIKLHPNTYHTVISACITFKDSKQAFSIFDEMIKSCLPPYLSTLNILIDELVKDDNINEAKKFFKKYCSHELLELNTNRMPSDPRMLFGMFDSKGLSQKAFLIKMLIILETRGNYYPFFIPLKVKDENFLFSNLLKYHNNLHFIRTINNRNFVLVTYL